MRKPINVFEIHGSTDSIFDKPLADLNGQYLRDDVVIARWFEELESANLVQTLEKLVEVAFDGGRGNDPRVAQRIISIINARNNCAESWNITPLEPRRKVQAAAKRALFRRFLSRTELSSPPKGRFLPHWLHAATRDEQLLKNVVDCIEPVYHFEKEVYGEAIINFLRACLEVGDQELDTYHYANKRLFSHVNIAMPSIIRLAIFAGQSDLLQPQYSKLDPELRQSRYEAIVQAFATLTSEQRNARRRIRNAARSASGITFEHLRAETDSNKRYSNVLRQHMKDVLPP